MGGFGGIVGNEGVTRALWVTGGYGGLWAMGGDKGLWVMGVIKRIGALWVMGGLQGDCG